MRRSIRSCHDTCRTHTRRRAQATSRKAARKRRAELERELAGYAAGADRCDFEAALDRYADGATHELRSILARQYTAGQGTRFPAIGRN